eukprot:7380056-Prymnesium_polylepis.1
MWHLRPLELSTRRLTRAQAALSNDPVHQRRSSVDDPAAIVAVAAAAVAGADTTSPLKRTNSFSRTKGAAAAGACGGAGVQAVTATVPSVAASTAAAEASAAVSPPSLAADTNEVADWYFVNAEGASEGPISLQRVRTMTQEGGLSPQSLVWASHLPSWASVGEAVGGSEASEELGVLSARSFRPGGGRTEVGRARRATEQLTAVRLPP